MKKIFILAGVLALSATCFAQSVNVTFKKGKATMDEAYYRELEAKAQAYDELSKAQLNTYVDSASYAIGRDLFRSWDAQHLGINAKVAGQSLMDMAKGISQMDPNQDQNLLRRFQESFEQREQQRMQEMMASLDKNIAEGKDFLKQNSNSKQVRTTASGLQYRVVKEGNGKRPTINDQVKVHYTGSLINGKKFDSSYDRGTPITFPVNAVIQGWIEGLQLMDEGSKYILYVPYNLAYGEQPAGEIPPGSALIFEVELLEIIPQK